MSNNAQGSVKVLLLGDSGVGKSSLMLSFTCGTFDTDIRTTVGVDFRVKTVTVADLDGTRRTINLHLWDTAGQERFRTLTSSYYRGAHAVVLVYDVSEPQTFHGLQRWIDEADKFCRPVGSDEDDSGAVYLLIGNKTDMCSGDGHEDGQTTDMVVPREQAERLAQSRRMLLAFTSAKTRVGVEQAFDELARAVHERLQRRSVSRSSGLDLRGTNESHNSGFCC
ncbi:ADP ribosylation factor family 50S ribosome binding GTPase putative Ras of Complex Roc domain [Trypanosoma vivax]|uniref:Putative small GTP-binding protein Rab18 n=1 Tax=Trypanosoma vivax (strain Y486) TaxID=1055687 RepID=G0U158_TRYVY|nr:putative small GTP-binding protein Rab18 [Trypanosoma vivax]KAH8609231.1 ADP ribosylation factor family 50S ribosome binding GTPase putative Ras of Complex Roc domain [Trypanosoma vivax]CCC49813.1 putative small GTP-binding protein Rab18 [Trypanosoma vivax Y486]